MTRSNTQSVALAAIAASVLATAAPAHAIPLLVNGGFGDGLTGWTVQNDGVAGIVNVRRQNNAINESDDSGGGPGSGDGGGNFTFNGFFDSGRFAVIGDKRGGISPTDDPEENGGLFGHVWSMSQQFVLSVSDTISVFWRSVFSGRAADPMAYDPSETVPERDLFQVALIGPSGFSRTLYSSHSDELLPCGPSIYCQETDPAGPRARIAFDAYSSGPIVLTGLSSGLYTLSFQLRESASAFVWEYPDYDDPSITVRGVEVDPRSTMTAVGIDRVQVLAQVPTPGTFALTAAALFLLAVLRRRPAVRSTGR